MKRPKKSISYENEDEYIKYLREYYRKNYRWGENDDSFHCWIEGKIVELFYKDEES